MIKMGKIVEYGNLSSVLKNLQGKRIVLGGGVFDLFHYGHLCYLKEAKKQGNILMIALEPNIFIVERKKRNPVHTLDQRAQILSSLEMVDYVIKLPFFKKDEDYFQMVGLIKPNIIAITENDPKKDQKLEQAKMVGAQLKTVCPLIKSLSTSLILNGKIISGN